MQFNQNIFARSSLLILTSRIFRDNYLGHGKLQKQLKFSAAFFSFFSLHWWRSHILHVWNTCVWSKKRKKKWVERRFQWLLNSVKFRRSERSVQQRLQQMIGIYTTAYESNAFWFEWMSCITWLTVFVIGNDFAVFTVFILNVFSSSEKKIQWHFHHFNINERFALIRFLKSISCSRTIFYLFFLKEGKKFKGNGITSELCY